MSRKSCLSTFPVAVSVGALACVFSMGNAYGVYGLNEASEQTATVSNVVTERYGAFLKVTYDLTTSDDAPAFMFGAFSEDGGVTFAHAMRTVAGDMNRDVAPGPGRWFVWNFHADDVAGLVSQARVRVTGGASPGLEREFGGMRYCWIPPGTFAMGSSEGETDRGENEGPQRQVTLTRGFWMSKYPVTEEQWNAISDAPPPISHGDNYPAEMLTWDAVAGPAGFLGQYNTMYPGNDFRLPTEAEWEYACRAGTTTRFYWGDDPDYEEIDAYAWYEENNPDAAPKPVGQKLPNAWGLHDMVGNIAQWCSDWYWFNYLEDDITDPTGPAYEDLPDLYGEIGTLYLRVIRGSQGFQAPSVSRSAYRSFFSPGESIFRTGFRVVRPVMTFKDDSSGDSPGFTLDARTATLAPFLEETPYTAVSALADGMAEAMRDLSGDSYPDAFQDHNADGVPDAFEMVDAEGRYTAFLDINDNTFPDWFETRYATPIAKFVFETLDIESRTVTVRNVSVGGAPGMATITGYQWDFGDGTVTEGFETDAHTYGELENYSIVLTLQWEGGAPVRWERDLLTGIQGSVVYVDAEYGYDQDGFGGSWQTPFQSLSHAMTAAVDMNAEMIWVRAGIYAGTADAVLTLRKDIVVYGGFMGNESSLAQRDLSARHESIIDGEYARCCVVGANNAVLDGFTVRHGQYGNESGIYCKYTAPEIRNCIIVDNEYSGVYCDGDTAQPTLVNCVVARNDIGVLASWDARPDIRFCTIADNASAGILLNNALVDVSGAVLWDNGEGVVFDEGSVPEIFYSLVQGGAEGTGNLNADPLFRDAAAGDYRLLPGSPALDAGWAPVIPGADILGQSRPWGAGPDMGAFEYQGATEAETEELPLETTVERSLAHGQSLVFAVPTDGLASGDLVAMLTPVSGNGTWRSADEAGNEGFATADGQVTITPHATIHPDFLLYTVTYLDFSDPSATGVFQFRVDLYARYAAPWPEVMPLGGTATATIRGVGFVQGMQVELRDGGDALLTSFVPIQTNANRLRVVLDGTGLPPGMATIAVVWPDNDVLYLADAVDIVASGVGAILDARLEAPPAMRPDRQYTLWLHYANTGDANMDAPLFLISCPDVWFRLSPDDPWRANSLQVLGTCAEAPVAQLPPGTHRSIPVHILIGGLVGEHLGFSLKQMPHNTVTVDWDGYSDLLRPRNISPAEWDDLWPALQGHLGNTWGDYLDVLYHEAALLAAIGIAANGVDALVPPAIRRALGWPVARIHGRVINRDTGAPISGVMVKAQETGTNTFHRAPTDEDGYFCLTEVGNGVFGLYVEGWHSVPEVVVQIVEQMDATHVTLDVHALTEPPPPPAPALSKRTPIVTVAPDDRLWMLWSQETQTRWAVMESGAWVSRGVARDTGTPVKALAYVPGLFGAEDGLYSVWEHVSPPPLAEEKKTVSDRTEIHASLAQVSDATAIWSDTCVVSGRSYENVLPAAVWHNGELLLVWLQFDPDAVGGLDDTDLYYALHDTDCFVYESQSLPEKPDASDKAQHCVDVRLHQGTILPNSIPLIGGRYNFDLNFNACGEESCEAGRNVSGAISMTVELSQLLSGKVSGSGSGNWAVVCEPAPAWVFSQATITAAGEVVATVEVPIPIIAAGVPLGTAYVGYTARAGVSGTLIWKANFPGWPTSGYIDGTLGGSGLLRFAGLDFGRTLKDGMVGIKGEAITMVKVRWVPLTSVTFMGYCVTLVGEVSALNGLVKYTIDGSWGPACGKDVYPYLQPGGPYVVKSDTTQEWIWIGDESAPHAITLTLETASGAGTGGVYEGLPVLDTVAQDLYGDGAPVLIHDGIRPLLLWTKDSDQPQIQTGSRIAWTTFEDTDWSQPAYIEHECAINGKPAAAVLANDEVMAVWAQASAEGLTENSPVSDVLDSAVHTQLKYALYDGEAWSVPQSIVGANQEHIMHPALAADSEGNAVVVWLSGGAFDTQQMWGIYWDGNAWSAPVVLGAFDHADAPMAAATEQGFVVIAAIASYDAERSELVWDLYETRRTQDAWSSLTLLPEFLFEPFAPAPDKPHAVRGNAGISAMAWNKGLPEDCCEEGENEGEDEEDGEPPEPPEPPLEDGLGDGGDVIGSVDPNEKHSTGGLGDLETQRYIAAGDMLEYVIFFENLSTATAPAQEIFITDWLPDELAWDAFQMHEIAWGDHIHPVTQTRFDAYAASVYVPDHRLEVDKTWRVDITFSMDAISGQCLWTLRTIDPDTGELPEDVWAGMLPPNDPEGNGEGHIVFSIQSKDSLPDAARIENNAEIVFDTNEAIVTNTIFNIVANPPEAAFSASHSGGEAPLTVAFTNLTTLTPGSLTAWMWNFGDGTTSTEEHPIHTFANVGEHDVWLTVVTPVGEDKASARILVTTAPVEDEGEGEGEGAIEGERETPEGEGEPPSDRVVVPHIIGQAQEEAVALLEGLGLQAVIQEEGRKAPKGQITAQAPVADTQVEVGATVTLTVSRGRVLGIFGCGAGTHASTLYRGDILLLLLLLVVLALAPGFRTSRID